MTGSLSTEHVVPKWVRKILRIGEAVKEFSGTTYVGAAETLAIAFHEVCVSCNTGWMEALEPVTRPVLGPLLLGAAPRTSHVLHPDQQAILATWAVKTSLLLTLSKFRGQDHGWIPARTLQWLYQHHDSRMPPPGARVWMSGLSSSVSDAIAANTTATVNPIFGTYSAQLAVVGRCLPVPAGQHSTPPGNPCRSQYGESPQVSGRFSRVGGRSATMLRVSRRCSSVGRAAVL
jgi:hypothetical protein